MIVGTRFTRSVEAGLKKVAALEWRAMAQADLDAVCAVARTAFPNHHEDRDVFAERLALNPGGCFVLAAGDEPARGYLIAYPWRLDDAPALNTAIGALPDAPNVLYLHDLALAPEARGGGHAARIVQRLAEQAAQARWPAIALVAVNRAAPFWTGLGFLPRDNPDMRRKLASYGDDACYMVRATPSRGN
jgi:ribosomal protein S18 acetylase RimI-like enzyme